jgi:hypothetical protein
MINTLSLFEHAGFISTEGSGRIKIIRLTPQGEDIAHEIEGLLRRFDRIEIAQPDAEQHDEFSTEKISMEKPAEKEYKKTRKSESEKPR